MDRSITRCQKSSYWDSSTEEAYSWFKTIMEFRRLHHRGTSPSPCKAIALSRNFESTQSRDAIFSLLGLSSDGKELVSTATYLQPIELVAANLTRALIERYKHLDFLWITEVDRNRSKLLPSWSPDWLSDDLSMQDHVLEAMINKEHQSRFYLGKNIGKVSFKNGKVLRVEGLTLGRIVATTTSTDPADMSLLRSSPSAGPRTFSDSPNSIKYTSYQVFAALLSCFTVTRKGQHIDLRKLKRVVDKRLVDDKRDSRFVRRLVWQLVRHQFCLRCVSRETKWYQPPCDIETPELHAKRAFSHWLEANAKFQIHGKTLEEWTQEQLGNPLYSMIVLWLHCFFRYPRVIARLFFITCLMALFGSALLVIARWNIISIIFIPLSCLFAYLFFVGVPLLRACGISKQALAKTTRPEWDNLTQAVRPGKKLLVTDRDFLGMTNDRVKSGDMICNLIGCSEPVVLREIQREENGQRDEGVVT